MPRAATSGLHCRIHRREGWSPRDALGLANEWQKRLRNLYQRERPPNKLPLLFSTVGSGNAIEEVSSSAAEACGHLPREILLVGHWLHLPVSRGDAPLERFLSDRIRPKDYESVVGPRCPG
jgi:hypothetical protein